jgi:hypothetical protein
MRCYEAKCIAFTKTERAEFGIADADRFPQHGCKYRLQIAGRTADSLKDLRTRCLLLQCLSKVRGALAQFVEQPRVLNGNDGLGSEVLDQFDLLVGERSNLLAKDADCANQFVVFYHWETQQRPNTCTFGGTPQGVVTRITLISQYIGDLYGRLCAKHTTETRTGYWLNGRAAQALQFKRSGSAMDSNGLKRAIGKKV